MLAGAITLFAETMSSKSNEPKSFEPMLSLNEATIGLVPSSHALERVDVDTVRSVKLAPGAALAGYHEMVEGLPGSRIVKVRVNGQGAAEQKVPAHLELPLDGTVSFTLLGGVCSSLPEAVRQYGETNAAFEWVGLLNRYRAQVARLVVKLSPIEVDHQRPFASVSKTSSNAATQSWSETRTAPTERSRRSFSSSDTDR